MLLRAGVATALVMALIIIIALLVKKSRGERETPELTAAYKRFSETAASEAGESSPGRPALDPWDDIFMRVKKKSKAKPAAHPSRKRSGYWWEEAPRGAFGPPAPLRDEKKRTHYKSLAIILSLAFVLLIGGIGVVFYPDIQQKFYERDVRGFKQSFFEQVEQKKLESAQSAEAAEGESAIYDALYEKLKYENEQLYLSGQSGLNDAFSYEQPAVELSEYGIIDNCIGFISLPTIGMELPIYLGANTENMRNGAVHLTQTSYPVGGVNTNSVIAAHRGTSLVMFRNIHLIEIGDEIIITNFREKLTYRAAEIKIINPSDIGQILIQEGRDLVTLISCNPLGQNYERYVLYCERVP
jgi:sortase A